MIKTIVHSPLKAGASYPNIPTPDIEKHGLATFKQRQQKAHAEMHHPHQSIPTGIHLSQYRPNIPVHPLRLIPASRHVQHPDAILFNSFKPVIPTDVCHFIGLAEVPAIVIRLGVVAELKRIDYKKPGFFLMGLLTHSFTSPFSRYI
jgi:hypothetical protein